jgi:hypothetical protein
LAARIGVAIGTHPQGATHLNTELYRKAVVVALAEVARTYLDAQRPRPVAAKEAM